MYLFLYFFLAILSWCLLQCYAYYSKERELLKTGEATLYFSQTILQEQKNKQQKTQQVIEGTLNMFLVGSVPYT